MSNVSAADLERVVKSTSDLSTAGLATKILVTRLRKEFAANPSSMGKAVAELSAFVAKYPFAANDFRAT